MTEAEQKRLDADIAEWTQLKTWMATAKERESYLRGTIASRVFDSHKLPTGAFPEGTTNTSVGPYRAKLGSTWKRDVLEELLVPTLTEAALTPAEQKDLIKMNPVLSVTAYRKLPEEKRKIVDKMLVTKPGSITLDVVTVPQ